MKFVRLSKKLFLGHLTKSKFVLTPVGAASFHEDENFVTDEVHYLRTIPTKRHRAQAGSFMAQGVEHLKVIRLDKLVAVTVLSETELMQLLPKGSFGMQKLRILQESNAVPDWLASKVSFCIKLPTQTLRIHHLLTLAGFTAIKMIRIVNQRNYVKIEKSFFWRSATR